MKIILQSRFFKNTIIYTISDVLNKMVPFLLLPVLTRYMTTEDYGIIAIFFVLTSMFGIFMSLETLSAIPVVFFKISRDALKVYLVNILLVIAVITSVFFLFIILFHSLLSEIFSISYEWLIMAVVVTLSQFMTTINLLLWQAEQNPVPLGMYQISQTVVNLLLSLILVIGFGMKWEGRLIAVAFASILFGMLSFVFLYKRDYLKFELNKEDIKDVLKFGVPMLPHTLSIWFRTGVDRIFLTMLISTSATGLYTVGYQIAAILTILATAFQKAYTPYLYQKLKNINEDEKINLVKNTYLYYIVLIFIAGLLSLLAPSLMGFLLGKDFLASQQYVVWLAFGFAFYGMQSIMVNYILYMKRTASLSYVTFSVSLLHVALSYMLIKYNGALGAAQATLITSLILFVVVWMLSQKIYKMPWFYWKKEIVL